MKYRSEIDGLRALAVIPVVLCHAGLSLFSGGYVGVDIFFVISGYLITTIIVNDIEQGRFIYTAFMMRRIKRILPVLYLVLIVSSVFSFFLLNPSQMISFSSGLISVIFYYANIFLWSSSDYFSPISEENPLLHTWSLAVEEQFYIIFPFVLLLMLSKSKRLLLPLIVTCVFLSLFLSHFMAQVSPNANFYLLPTRAWELGAGAVCALILRKYSLPELGFLAWLGILMIFISIFFYDSSTPFPSFYSILPVLGSCLIVCFARNNNLPARLLSVNFLVWVGLVSYSFYLWHQPILAFSRVYVGGPTSIRIALFGIFLAFLCACITYRFVEVPIRKSKVVTNKIVLVCVTMVSLLLVAFSSFGLLSDGFYRYWANKNPLKVNLYDRSISTIPDVQEMMIDNHECKFRIKKITNIEVERIKKCNIKYGEGVLIVGDSHGSDVFLGYKIFSNNNFVVGYTRPGCRFSDLSTRQCDSEKIVKEINKQAKYFSNLVYTQSGVYLIFDGSGRTGRSIFQHLSHDSKVPNDSVIINADSISKVITYLNRMPLPVTWLGPRFEPYISQNYIIRHGCSHKYSYRENQFDVFNLLDKKINSMVEKDNIRYFSQLYSSFGPKTFSPCETMYWRDGDHWSKDGIEFFMKANFSNGL